MSNANNEQTASIMDMQDMMHKIRTKITCAECITQLTSEDILNNIKIGLNVIETKMTDICHHRKIKNKLMGLIKSHANISMHCSANTELVIGEMAEIFINQWCDYINKIINGEITEPVYNNYMISQALEYASRNKKTNNHR